MHPALRSRIRGYGYEVYMNDTMKDTPETKDAIARSNSIIFHVLVIILNIFLPIFWLMIYLLIRPARTLLDKYYEDLEFQALTWHDKKFCGKCNALIEDGFNFCGKCWEDLMQKCKSCKKDFSKEYKICPFCGVNQSDKK